MIAAKSSVQSRKKSRGERKTKPRAKITAEAAPVDPSQLANADGAKPKPGLVSKFFSWLTSGTDDKSAADNGIRRGLGGPTDE